MKAYKTTLILLVSVFSINTSFQSIGIDYTDREGDSYFIGKRKQKKLDNFYEKIPQEVLHGIFNQIMTSSKTNSCSVNLLNELKALLPETYLLQSDMLLLAMRDMGFIDDVVLSILKKAQDIKYTKQIDMGKSYANDIDEKEKITAELKKFLGRKQKGRCPTDIFRDYYYGIKNIAGNQFDTYYLEQVHSFGLYNNILTTEEFELLESFRQHEVFDWDLNIPSYHEKLRFNRTQKPIINNPGTSNFISSESVVDKKSSYRMRLYQRYTPFQIALMADLVRKLRERFAATSIDIIIRQEDTNFAEEVITLDPMEQFRLILNILHKELHGLSQHNNFSGVQPSYTDLIAAAFELDLIPLNEIEALAELEEIWNPKKTRWQKWKFWIKTIGTSGAILLPSPYGFLSVLGVMIIEETTKNSESNLDHSLIK